MQTELERWDPFCPFRGGSKKRKLTPVRLTLRESPYDQLVCRVYVLLIGEVRGWPEYVIRHPTIRVLLSQRHDPAQKILCGLRHDPPLSLLQPEELPRHHERRSL